MTKPLTKQDELTTAALPTLLPSPPLTARNRNALIAQLDNLEEIGPDEELFAEISRILREDTEHHVAATGPFS